MNTTLQIRLPWEGTGDIKGANSSLPRVYSGQRMYGALDVSTQTGNEPVFDAAEIVFEGNITSFIHSAIVNEGASWTVKRQLVHLTDSQPSANFHSASSRIPGNGTVHTSFHFDIPETVSDPHLSGESESSFLSAESNLPPSATLRKAYAAGKGPADRGDGRSGTCDVTYQIRARLILRNKIIAETTRKVQLVPITEPSPPLDVRDFTDEFQLSTTGSVVEPLKLKKRGQLSVAVAQPSPLVFSLDNPVTTASTRLNLKFQFRSSSKNAIPPSLPDLTDCTVTSGLEALTHFSVIPQDMALSKREVKRLPQVAQVEWKAKPQARKLKLSNWQRVGDNDSNISTWETTASVVISPHLDSPAYILPTFRSPFVSRRYALDLKVKVRSPSEHIAHLTLDLRTPVQVLYTSTAGAGAAEEKGDVEPVVQIACGGCRDRKRVEDLTIESVLVAPPVYTYR